jgi:hypothetical protein
MTENANFHTFLDEKELTGLNRTLNDMSCIFHARVVEMLI